MKEEHPSRDTPEESQPADQQSGSSKSNIHNVKDRKCQYCNQAFTSSSLGRHLDQFLFKKKPDGVHDVEEIRRIRSGITRRQARTNLGKRECSPHGSQENGSSDAQATGETGPKGRDGSVRMMFNTPTWHATGVINDLPNPSNVSNGSRIASTQSRAGSFHLPDFASRGASAYNPDTMKALELALREVLDNVKAATSRLRPPSSPFEFSILAETFPALCLRLLPPPPSLFATHPFPSPTSFPLQPPGAEHVESVRQALRSKVAQWQSEQIAGNHDPHIRDLAGLTDRNMILRTAQQHEEMGLRHLELAFNHWSTMPPESRIEVWQLEITRAFAREVEKRKSVEEQLARVQQEANQLRGQIERLGACQWPREFALFPPDMLPLSRDVARELDAQESQISPDSSRWDYDNLLAKWKRVVMHDKSLGRSGGNSGNPNVLAEFDNSHPKQSLDGRLPRPGENTSSHMNRLRPMQPGPTMSPDPAAVSTPASSTHYASPYSHADTRSPPGGNAGPPHTKRPRLMNESGAHSNADTVLSTTNNAPGAWPSATPILSTSAARPSQTPPSASRG